jgi:peptidoglycan hydrolase CwlO-like protein
MHSVQKNPSWLVLVAIIALAVGPSFAADKPAKDPSKRLQQQLRQAEQEKAQLNQKVAEAESQLKDVQEKSAATKRQADEASGRAARLNKELDSLRSQSAAEKDALTAKLAETERKLADLKVTYAAEKQQLEGNVARQRTALAGCSERNARMYKLGNDLLDKYEEKSCMTSVLQAEPFTGLKRAQIEKFVEDEREKLDKDELNPGQKTPIAFRDQ